MSDYLVLLLILFLGMVSLLIYTLSVALRQVCKQLARSNERLLVMVSIKEFGEKAARAVVASGKDSTTKSPKHGAPKGVAKGTPENGVKLTYGI